MGIWVSLRWLSEDGRFLNSVQHFSLKRVFTEKTQPLGGKAGEGGKEREGGKGGGGGRD